MNKADRNVLYMKAHAATPDSWKNRIGVGACDYIVKAERSCDAEFIAAADPATVLDLLNQIERLKCGLRQALQLVQDLDDEEDVALFNELAQLSKDWAS